MPGPHAVIRTATAMISPLYCCHVTLMRAEKKTSDASKMARSSRRLEKLAENDAYEEMEGLLYAPGIAN